MMKTVLCTRLLSVKIDHTTADDVKAKILGSPPVSKHQISIANLIHYVHM